MGWRYFCAFWAFLSERVSFLFFSFLFCFVSGRATESGAVRIANRFCGKRLNTLIAYWFWKGCGFSRRGDGGGGEGYVCVGGGEGGRWGDGTKWHGMSWHS